MAATGGRALGADAVHVELFAEGVNGAPPVREEMKRGENPIGSGSAYIWSANIAAERPASDYTPRAIPWHPAALVPLESQKIVWYR
jgi:starch phosphorylase